MTSPSLSEVRELYDEAEKALKKYERIGLDNLVSSINELRYAGHHVLVVETTKDGERKEEHLFKAARHCKRAIYDAKEATIIHLLEVVASFREYGVSEAEISSIVPDWPKFMKAVIEAQRILETAGHAKDADPELLDSAIETLLSARETLLAAESRILTVRNSKLDAMESHKKSVAKAQAQEAENRDLAREICSIRQFLLSFAISTGGTFIGLCGTLIAVYGEFENHRLVGVLICMLGLAIMMRGVYGWAERHLLTNGAKELIRKGLGKQPCSHNQQPKGKA